MGLGQYCSAWKLFRAKLMLSCFIFVNNYAAKREPVPSLNRNIRVTELHGVLFTDGLRWLLNRQKN